MSAEAARAPKLLFAGPMGAGKTTAIRTISDIATVQAEVQNLDKSRHDKAETTVGFDYGEVRLDGGDVLRLYGLPGQQRFEFMWRILSQGAFGVVLLVDNSQPGGPQSLIPYLESFDAFARSSAMVIGVGRLHDGQNTIDDYSSLLRARNLRLPVFATDVRERASVLLLLEALMLQIEAAEFSGP